jgi:CubicO group peptidase (beta-lactamase class C family)
MGLARAEAEMRRRVETGQVAGITTAAITGDTVAERCFGLLDIERTAPVRPNSLMRIYSLTKPVVAAGIMLLVERGLLDRADPIRRWLPAFGQAGVIADGSPPTEMAATDITVAHLLTHTAGLAYGFQEGPVAESYRTAGLLSPILRLCHPLPQTVERIAGLPLGSQPGARWTYSMSFDVLGYLIELVTGDCLGQFLGEELFGPLGMVDTRFSVPAGAMDRFGPLYGPPTGGGLPIIDPTIGSPFTDEESPPSGGAGLVSTLRDYTRFALMLANDGRLDQTRVLRPETMHAMINNHIDGTAPPIRFGEDTLSYGYGLGVGTAPVHKFGWGGASGCTMWTFPDQDLIATALTQSFTDFSTANAFIDALLDKD